MRRRPDWVGLILLLALLALGGTAAQAQETDFLRLRAVDAAEFPQVTLWFDAFANERFITQARPADVLAIEDMQPRPVEDLELLQPGVRLVVAVNLGPQLALRDEEGVSRLEKVFAVLDDWAAAQPADSTDLWSLIGPGGALALHQPPSDWREALAAYQPDARNTEPDLRALSFALDAALDAPPDPLMKTVVLLISPHLEGEALTLLENQQQRALEANIPVLVWWVDSEAYAEHSGTLALQTLAAASGGQFTAFDEATAFTPPEAFLDSWRYVWRLTYRSALTSAGEHSFGVALTLPDGRQLVSDTRPLLLEIAPPNPILVTPPTQIVRQIPPETAYEVEALEPKTQELEILIEFPDGHPRNLVRTTLYVDDQIVAENFSPPFDRFSWDLRPYTTSGQHVLRVEAVDELGLSQVTVPWTVTVTVVQPPRGVLGTLTRYRTEITWGAIGGAGLLAALLLLGSLRRRGRKPTPEPAAAPPLPTASSAAEKRTRWRTRRGASPSGVYLQPYGEGAGSRPIPLDGAEVTFGSDPVKARVILDDPSISALHARIVRETEGYRLLDADSLAGVWLNFAPVPPGGVLLRAGDVVHFGRLGYRFWLGKISSPPRPQILQEQEDDD